MKLIKEKLRKSRKSKRKTRICPKIQKQQTLRHKTGSTSS
jgi:hypothetical protein